MDVDVGGRIYVLDSRFNQIRVFGASGRFITAAGRPGSGPGDLLRPRAIALGADGTIYVGDQPNKVHLFRWTEGEPTIRYVRSVDVGVNPFDMCLLGDTLVVHGVTFGATIVLHTYDSRLAPLKSFGTVYQSGDPMVNFQTARGHIACDEQSREVLFAPTSLLGEVRAYRLDGTATRLTDLVGFRPIETLSFPNGSSRVQVPEGGYHRIRSVNILPSGRLVVQLAFATRASRQAREEFASLMTFWLDGNDGTGEFLGRNALQVARIVGHSVVLVQQDPFPSAIIVQWEPGQPR